MGDQQHLEWLLEGTAAWNQRRENDDFVPNFEGVDIRSAFENANKLMPAEVKDLTRESYRFDLQGIDLSGARFSRSNLLGADLSKANLTGSKLVGATLIRCLLRGAILRHAKLDSSDLRGVDLRGAEVSPMAWNGADVSTFQLRLDRNETLVTVSDLSNTDIYQSDLDTMQGDSETIIPSTLARPQNWPTFEREFEPKIGPTEHVEKAEKSDEISHERLNNQISSLISERGKFRTKAATLSAQLEDAIAIFRASNMANELPDDLLLIEDVTSTIGGIHRALSVRNSSTKKELLELLPRLLKKMVELERLVAAQSREIQKLNDRPSEKSDLLKFKSAFAISFGTTLGAGTAATLLGAGQALLGEYGDGITQQLRDTFNSFFGATSAALPSTIST